MMPIFLNPRFGLLLLVGVPMLAGATVHPQGGTAFLLGAWAGVLIVGPPIMLIAWALGIRTIGQVLAPLFNLPALLILTAVVLFVYSEELGLGAQVAGIGAAFWWVKRKIPFI